MARTVTSAVMLEAGLIMIWVWFSAVRRRPLNRAQVLALLALQAIVVGHAVAAVIGLGFAGDEADAGTLVAYALGSIVVLPVLIGVPIRLGFAPPGGGPAMAPQFRGGIEFGAGRPGVRDAEQWRAAIAGVGALSVVVMVERMFVTWQGGPLT